MEQYQNLRAIVAVLDSVGIGAGPDAGRFVDAKGATFDRIAEACAGGKIGRSGHS